MHMTATRWKRCAGILGLFAVLAVLLLAAPVAAQDSMRFDEEVRELFFAGFAGNEDALARGMAICEETLQADPDHPGALVWQASGWMFQSGMAYQEGDWAKGMALFDDATAQMDRAVSLAPDSLQTLIPRASVYLGVAPYIYDTATRTRFLETVVDDYTKVLAIREPYFASLTAHSRGELLGALAEALWRLQRRNDAQVYLDRILAELPDSAYALMAERQLAEPQTIQQLTCLGCHKY